MKKRGALAAGAAAGLLAIAGFGARLADDVARLGGRAHEPPPIGAGGGLLGGSGAAAGAHVTSQIDSFVTSVSDSIAAAPEQARAAGVSVACNVAYLAFVEARLPTDREWVGIGTDALAGAALEVPVGSGAWRELEGVKDEVSDAVSDELGYVDSSEAESIGSDLACAWA